MATEKDMLRANEGNSMYRKKWLRKLAELREVIRFDGENFDGARMIHQTNLDMHEARTQALHYQVGYALLAAGIRINYLRSSYLLQFHDDQEVVTKDIPTPVKSAMTPEERAKLRAREEKAARALARRYALPQFKALYLELWNEAQAKQTPEAQAADVADKWDALGEVIHEIRCGNKDFLDILERYRILISKRLETSPIWQAASSHPYIRFDQLPTHEEAERLPRISLDTFEKIGYNTFWHDVLQPPDLPEFYKRWMVATFHCGLDWDEPGTPLFPGWPNEGLEKDPKKIAMMLPFKKIH